MKVNDISVTAAVWIPEDRVTVVDAVTDGLITPADQLAEGFESLSVAGDLTGPAMAVTAARQALDAAHIDANEIDLLIHAWIHDQGPGTWTPPHRVARELGARRCEAIGVQQMSNGGAAALHLAVARMIADPTLRTALVTTADNFTTLPYNRWRGTPPLGDGATAALLRRTAGQHTCGSRTITAIASAGNPDLEFAYPTQDPFASRPLEDGPPHGRLPNRAAVRAMNRCTADATTRALKDAGLDPDDSRIRRVLVPRFGHTLIDHVVTAALPGSLRERIEHLGAQTGHLGSGDLAANLATSPPPAPGTVDVLISAGAGYTSTCVIIEERGDTPR